MGRNLAEMHALTWPFAGEYDLASDTIKLFDDGYADWFVSDVRLWPAEDFQPCFVMNDYDPGNVTVDSRHGEWRVTGIFDLRIDGITGNGFRYQVQ